MNYLLKVIKIFVEIQNFFKALFFSGTISNKYRNYFHLVFYFYDPVKLYFIAKSIQHVFGPSQLNIKNNEAVVFCLVRNGEKLIQEFISHYQSKGFKHIFFLDNDSQDQTILLASQYKNITILSTKTPFKDNDLLLRRYLLKRFAPDSWSLTVDLDEFWDYPFSHKLSLELFLQYLDNYHYSAVIGQMLDLFMAKLPTEKQSLQAYEFYDTSAIVKQPLTMVRGFQKNHYSNSEIMHFSGGIRAKIFNLQNLWLTKMPLIKGSKSLLPLVHQHYSQSARVADLSTVLFHYKFREEFIEQVAEAVNCGQYANNSSEYQGYEKILKQSSEVTFLTPTASTFQNMDQLLKEEFILISAEYLIFVKKINDDFSSHSFPE